MCSVLSERGGVNEPKRRSGTLPALLLAAIAVAGGATAAAAQSEVVIGNLDDLSGVYSEDGGPGSVEAERMAIADFGGEVLGRRIVALVADHQNKPDIGASRFREWADQKGLDMMIAGANTGVAIAMAKVAVAKRVPLLIVGAGGSSLTNEDCTPYSIHYVFDTTAVANGTASTVLKSGGKTWFYISADYAFGTQLVNSASAVVEASGGRNLGVVRVPLSSADFSSYLLQAQSSGAQVLAFANAGDDFQNALKAAREFGITRTMQPVALVAFINNIRSLGLETAQGLYLTTSWYWDLNDETRAFARRFFGKMQSQPTMTQAGTYSATLTYLKAVKAAGSTDSDKVMAELRRTKIDDLFTKGGYLRADGVMVHDMYVMQVKSPRESKYPWDYYKVVDVMAGARAFGPITGRCATARR
ncbi:MAG TPA: ABC transporter substrate-binding protein [Steroidobacteraceae bacterium]|nr:ABC transporter substrate-binding protein [Steroidobacteraceae bacterium]